jgi:hypothetical protein
MSVLNKKYGKIIVVGVAGVILLVALLNFYPKDEEIKVEPVQDTVVDNRISPLTDQAVFVEIKQIRKIGIIDQMMDTGALVERVNDRDIGSNEWIVKGQLDQYGLNTLIKSFLPGNGWDDEPTFTYQLTIDGFEWKPVVTNFTTWNTGFIFQESYKVVEEEQEHSTVRISILENEDGTGLFRRSVSQKEVDSFQVTYDFRNGTWQGDDFFNDSDGYGHYVGDEYDIWFDIRQTDYDGDGIPYWTEVNILKTDPRFNDFNSDPDCDGCSTAWEWKWGYDPFIWDNHTFLDPDNDGLQNVEEEYMMKWISQPFYPQMYIEVDLSEKDPDIISQVGKWKIEMKEMRLLPLKRPAIVRSYIEGDTYELWPQAKEMIIERFGEHGIAVYFDDGSMGGGGETLPYIADEDADIIAEPTQMSEIYKKHFADDRKGIFRYLVICNGGGWAYNEDFIGMYDTMVVPQSTEYYRGSLLLAFTERAQIVSQAISIFHEIGHTCGFGYLHCGGVDNMSTRTDFDELGYVEWHDYQSVMNYYWYGCRYFDYSDGSHGPNDVDDWGLLDVGYFQRTQYDPELEGIAFDRTEPPYNRGEH